MKAYKVSIPKIYIATYVVDASDTLEAIERVLDGKGTKISEEFSRISTDKTQYKTEEIEVTKKHPVEVHALINYDRPKRK